MTRPIGAALREKFEVGGASAGDLKRILPNNESSSSDSNRFRLRIKLTLFLTFFIIVLIFITPVRNIVHKFVYLVKLWPKGSKKMSFALFGGWLWGPALL